MSGILLAAFESFLHVNFWITLGSSVNHCCRRQSDDTDARRRDSAEV